MVAQSPDLALGGLDLGPGLPPLGGEKPPVKIVALHPLQPCPRPLGLLLGTGHQGLRRPPCWSHRGKWA